MQPLNDENPVVSLSVPSNIAGQRVDAFLSEKIEGWSRSRLRRLIDEGDVLVNERPVKASYRLREGDEIEVEHSEAPAAVFEPENIPLEIVFEDEYLAVINKPAGMVVHPGAGVSSGTLANAIAYHFKSEPPASAGGVAPETGAMSHHTPSQPLAHASGSVRIGIVHRLDKGTSGLIVVAKNEQIHEALADQFRTRAVSKSYIALVHGTLRENRGTIDRPIARDRWHRTKMTVAANGRYALSMWKVRQRFDKFTLLDVEIKTGRTHQIRVHLASLNHPIVGDEIYNEGRDKTINDTNIRNNIRSMGRFFLHSAKLSFRHPTTGEWLTFTSELPTELADLVELLNAQTNER